MFRQRSVKKGVIGANDRKDGPVVLEQVGEETDRLLLHRPAQAGEGGKMTLAFFIQRLEVMNLQPRASELGGQAGNPRIAKHSPRLGREHGRLMELAAGGSIAQLGVRR